MNRAEYNQCMKPHMTGSKTKEQRQKDMCVGAKLCSGKADNVKEAERLCAEAALNPKPPKEKKTRKVCTLRDLESIAVCVAENIELSSLTSENMGEIFANALKKCSGTKAKKITSAQKMVEEMDPKQIAAMDAIARLTKQYESKT